MPKAPETAVLPPFPEATAQFETWLRSHITVREADLDFKHEQMASGVFPFMRATFYRWMQLWPVLCPELATAPHVLAAGDLHVDNFGTWRDQEGRLVWGVNDFDETYPLAYTVDLVRLAVSARFAIGINRLRLSPRRACAALIDGYRRQLESGGTPFVLAEHHPVLRREAAGVLRDPVRFWQRLNAQPDDREPPEPAVRLLSAALPRAVQPRFVARRAGLGSLGHVRVVAIAEQAGGLLAREAKALAPSACVWAASSSRTGAIHYRTIVGQAGALRRSVPAAARRMGCAPSRTGLQPYRSNHGDDGPRAARAGPRNGRRDREHPPGCGAGSRRGGAARPRHAARGLASFGVEGDGQGHPA